MTPASTMGSQSRLRSASQSISLDSTPLHCTLSRTIGPTSPRKETAVATTINKCVYHLVCAWLSYHIPFNIHLQCAGSPTYHILFNIHLQCAGSPTYHILFNIHLQCGGSPTCQQTTAAAKSSQWESAHTLPHFLSMQISTLP